MPRRKDAKTGFEQELTEVTENGPLCCLPYLLFKIHLGDSARVKSSKRGFEQELTEVTESGPLCCLPYLLFKIRLGGEN
jgi:hypothetical protein